MTDLELTRAVAADPASVALLLSDPGAAGLWPGARAGQPSPLMLGTPSRTDDRFTADLAVHDLGLGEARGLLTVAPAVAGSSVRLVMSGPDPAVPILRQRAAAFLDELRAVAQSRSCAA